ncbi:hypothetical protein ACP4OV_008709 [Aristida adscensionis]
MEVPASRLRSRLPDFRSSILPSGYLGAAALPSPPPPPPRPCVSLCLASTI